MTPDTPPRIGVITGLAAEAACLHGRGYDIFCCGAQPARARVGVQSLISNGASGLVSFGLAGGLDPALAPGTLILAATIITPQGDHLETDSAWRQTIRQSTKISMIESTIAGSETALMTTDGKQALHHATGAVAVDMESHIVAAAAREAGLPFLVIRAVADPAARTIPDIAMAGVDAEGNTRIFGILATLLRRPGELPKLLQLAIDSRKAFAALRHAAKADFSTEN
ncbi:MAG: hypothetical protein HOI33_05715 [Rhodospirillaceae bacterium]|nr:hypothetical protein [Rhodospirillaceae bacterium]MBT5660111.1 hypothetical protein [Rhodospirillaceae bacterium]MBT5752189.1 hypothetical protein [Rhodospirillaceae bacterium]